MTEDRTCRICLASETDTDYAAQGPLFSPCHCKGSIAYVHKECLNTWRHSGNHLHQQSSLRLFASFLFGENNQKQTTENSRYYRCENCKFEYKLQRSFLSRCLTNHCATMAITILCFFCMIMASGFLGKEVTIYITKQNQIAISKMIRDSTSHSKQLSKYDCSWSSSSTFVHPFSTTSASWSKIPEKCASTDGSEGTCKNLVHLPLASIMTTLPSLYSMCQSTANEQSQFWMQQQERDANKQLLMERIEGWAAFWQKRYYSLDLVHFIFGCSVMSLLGLFHLVTFWKVYVDSFTHLMVTTEPAIFEKISYGIQFSWFWISSCSSSNSTPLRAVATSVSAQNLSDLLQHFNHSVSTAPDSMHFFTRAELILFLLLVLLGLLKSYLIVSEIMHRVIRYTLSKRNMDEVKENI